MTKDELIEIAEENDLHELTYRLRNYWDEEDQKLLEFTDIEFAIDIAVAAEMARQLGGESYIAVIDNDRNPVCIGTIDHDDLEMY